MDSVRTPLLDSNGRGPSVVLLPALQKLLQLAHSVDNDSQIEAVIGISELVKRRPVDSPSFGPLCHTLLRLVASEDRVVAAYAARSIKLLVLDDSLRQQAAAAGVPSALASAFKARESDLECMREILGALQTLCYDEATVLPVVDTGALGLVLELLGTQRLLKTTNLELRILSLAIAANVLSFSDSLLSSREDCIDAFCDRMGIFLGAFKSRDIALGAVGAAALANACAHPVLAGRAREIGVHEIVTKSLERESFSLEPDLVRLSWVCETVIARLNRIADGDVEEGRGGASSSVHPQFYSFKWGEHKYLGRWMPSRPFVAWCRSLIAQQSWCCVLARVVCLFCSLGFIAWCRSPSRAQRSWFVLASFLFCLLGFIAWSRYPSRAQRSWFVLAFVLCLFC